MLGKLRKLCYKLKKLHETVTKILKMRYIEVVAVKNIA